MANNMQAIIDAIRSMATRPADSRKIADTALRDIQAAGQQIVAAVNDAAAKAAAKSTPREKAITAIGRLLFLEMLDFHIKFFKEHATAQFQKAGLGQIGPSNYILGRVSQVQTEAREIEANLRRLAAIDGVDSAIYNTLVAHIKRVSSASLDASLTQENTRSDWKQDIGPYLAYLEVRVARIILEKMAIKYSRAAAFDLSRALMDLSAELAINNMKSMSRVRELTELYRREQNGPTVKAYYVALFAQIKGGA